MRWPQFLLTLVNLSFAVYILVLNALSTEEIDPIQFLWTLIYLALALAICHLYMLYMSNKIDDWYDVESMKSINNLSVVSLTLCAITLAIQLGLEYYHTKTITLIKGGGLLKSSIIPLVAALVCSLILFTSSIKFKKYVILCKSIDLQPTTRRYYSSAD